MAAKEFEWAARHLQHVERKTDSIELWKTLHEQNYPSFLKQQIDLAKEAGVSFLPLDKLYRSRVQDNCNICSDPIPAEAFDQNKTHECWSCSSIYCEKCVGELFTTALEDTTRMPAGCCLLFPTYAARQALPAEKVDEYRIKFEEYISADKSYCPVPTCSAFLPNRLFPKNASSTDKKRKRVDTPTEHDNSDHPHVPCPKCEIEICVACRQLAHAGAECAPPPLLDEKVERALRRWGYKRCPKCGHGVKRMFGCSHMQCRCGAHWCWCCCKPFDECSYGGDGSDGEDDEYYTDDDDEEEAQPRDVGETGEQSTSVETVGNGVDEAQMVAPQPDATNTAEAAEAVEVTEVAEVADMAETAPNPSDAPAETVTENDNA
jgi:hypothetical protein